MKTSFFCGVRWPAIAWAAGLIAMGWLGVSRLDAATIYVCPAGSDANDGLTWPTAKKTVQAGLNAAASDDQVWVAAGTYVENITLKSGVALYGGFAGGESDLAQRNWTTNVTVLDGNQQDRVVSLPLTPGQTARLDGFTIRNGRPYLGGGGILCGGGSPVIANNRITGNNVRPLEWGGGIFCEDGSPTIINNVITGNSASAGGGIYCWDGSPTIANNIIAGNSVYDSGGGICWKSHENLTLVNNTIIGNSASSGGGIYSGSSSFPTITNTVIAFNSSGIFAASGSGIPSVRCTCVYGNTAYNYSGLPDPTGTNGNISEDPKLAWPLYKDIHIQPDSPCIDAGDDIAVQAGWADMDGQSRIMGFQVDIGADESDGSVWPSGPRATVRVSPAGDDTNDGSSWALAKRTVQAGIDGAAPTTGDVWVAAGIYVENIVLALGVGVYGGFAGTETDMAQRNWAAHQTILDGNRKGSVLEARPGLGQTTRIDGFTIRNGTRSQGGGIYCRGASPIIVNNTIRGNRATSAHSAHGGGIYCDSASPTIANNTITGNTTVDPVDKIAGSGGGICCVSSSSPIIANNTITANVSMGTGGIDCYSSSPTIVNSIIALNSSGIATVSGLPLLRYNCVYGNGDSDFSGLADPTGANGNISADPKITGLAYGSVHIQAQSPCVDAGDDAIVAPAWTDVDGQARIIGAHVDIGADESDGTVWLSRPNVVVRVSTSGDDADDGSSWARPKRTIQAAIDAAAAASGDVWVKTGTYRERVFLRSYAHVYGGFAGTEAERSGRDWARNATVLDGNQGGSVVTAEWIGPGLSTLDGFTICNGKSSRYGGGGVYCWSASPTIANNMITRNQASGSDGYGGGICCDFSYPRIANNTIIGNSAGEYGGGICCLFSSPTISNNSITNNSTSVYGGGIYCYFGSPLVANSIVAFNSSGICGSASGTPVLRYNCVYGNTAYDYSSLTDPTGTNGNISADPTFVRQASPGPDGVWGTADDDYGDLRLLPGSPCIDAGNNANVPPDTADLDGDGDTTEPLPVDLGGYPRFLDDPATANTGSGTPPIVDIGAYEYVRPGDVTGDGYVDVVDLLFLARSWGKSAGQTGFDSRCDFDGDGRVSILDLLVLVNHWGM